MLHICNQMQHMRKFTDRRYDYILRKWYASLNGINLRRFTLIYYLSFYTENLVNCARTHE